ncbi:MAG: autotransporter domain-containing protein [Sedimentisphaerales bacterium]|nr:autotransporter domain-containing protein [Sedimentisphaerales bacterium]
MSGKRARVAVGLILAAWGLSEAIGAPMGPPAAVLEEGRWAVGLEYGYGESDLRAYGLYTAALTGDDPVSAFEVLEIEGLRSSMVLASLAFGVCDNWDLFVRLGVADAQDDVAAGTGRFAYGGGSGFAWGLGTRATFCQWGPWSFGGLAQVTWLDPGSSDFSATDPEAAGRVSVGRIDANLWQTQIGLAATYQIDTLHFWAGPYLEFSEGNLDRSGRILIDGLDSGSFQATGNIEERSQFGIHFGVTWEMSNALSWWTGGQATGDSWSVGFGGIIQPQQLFDRR